MTIFLRLMTCLTLLYVPLTSASALPIKWNVNFVFIDGSVATGSFVFDEDTTTFSNVAIEGPAWDGTPTFYSAFNRSGTFYDPVTGVTAPSNETRHFAFHDFNVSLMEIAIGAPLTNLGGSIAIYDPFELFGIWGGPPGNSSNLLQVIDGEVYTKISNISIAPTLYLLLSVFAICVVAKKNY